MSHLWRPTCLQWWESSWMFRELEMQHCWGFFFLDTECLSVSYHSLVCSGNSGIGSICESFALTNVHVIGEVLYQMKKTLIWLLCYFIHLVFSCSLFLMFPSKDNPLFYRNITFERQGRLPLSVNKILCTYFGNFKRLLNFN